MADVAQVDTPQDPAFITYLFTFKSYGCHFVVGNKYIAEPERIGVVKEMVMAHSEVLRSDMLVQDIKEGKCIAVTDLYPDTFRNLLRFVYGYDNTSSLCFEEADSLLYAAEKYMVEPLKARLVKRFSQLLTPDNICTLLNNPACHRVLELNSVISQVLQHETDKVFVSSRFLDLSPDALSKVFEQESMNVPEIEVWRAAIKWARHRTNSDNGQDLRKALEGPGKHIRVCAIDNESFFCEVYPAGILTEDEVRIITFSKLQNKKQDDLIVFSNEIECRTKQLRPCKLEFNNKEVCGNSLRGNLTIVTKQLAIELLPFKMKSAKWVNDNFIPKITYDWQCTITISRITDYVNGTSSKAPQIVKVCKQVEYDTEFTVPVAKGDKNIVLLPNSKYHLKVEFKVSVPLFINCDYKPFDDKYISVCLEKILYEDGQGFPFQTLFYQPLHHGNI